MTDPFELPINTETAEIAHDTVFAPWVTDVGLRDTEVSEGYATAVLPPKNTD